MRGLGGGRGAGEGGTAAATAAGTCPQHADWGRGWGPGGHALQPRDAAAEGGVAGVALHLLNVGVEARKALVVVVEGPDLQGPREVRGWGMGV